ncbi:MAG: hypothetical protein WBM32_19390 [Crocosphaera sp.]|jgi:hypothetical protein
MSNVIIELLTLAVMVVAVKSMQSQPESDAVVIPVRIDKTRRKG